MDIQMPAVGNLMLHFEDLDDTQMRMSPHRTRMLCPQSCGRIGKNCIRSGMLCAIRVWNKAPTVVIARAAMVSDMLLISLWCREDTAAWPEIRLFMQS